MSDDRIATLALESDMAILRAEAAILMDVVSELDDAMLERIPSGKLLKAWRACSESEKHKMFESKVDALTRSRDRLAELLSKAQHMVERRCYPNCLCGKCQWLIDINQQLAAIAVEREAND